MRSGKRAQRGFSLVELMVVVLVVLVLAAIAMPNLVTAVQNYRLRSSASQVSSLMQNARYHAVRTNQYVTILAAATASGEVRLGVTSGPNNTPVPQIAPVVLPRGVTVVNGPAPNQGQLGFNVAPVPGLPSFSTRGLPCVVQGFACRPPVSYSVTLQQVRSFGTPGFRAVVVSPTGRVQQWGLSGSTWSH